MKTTEPKSTNSTALQRSGIAPFFQPEESRDAFFGSSYAPEPFFKPGPSSGHNRIPNAIRTKRALGETNDAYEQKVAKDTINGTTDFTHTGKTIQRHAFINETQVDKGDKKLTPEMKALASDTLIRNYLNEAEFKKHADKKTDYLGNLPGPISAGTWLRFSDTGINILGENHTQVTLQDVTPAVGSKNFIRERFSSDDLSKNPNMKAAYEETNKEQFKKMGIENESDKQKFGGESLFPKMGNALTLGLAYFEGKKDIAGLKQAGYFGKPLQNYLKIAWAYSKDNVALVKQKTTAKEAIPIKMAALCALHLKVEPILDPFITKLVVDGFLGDELEKSTSKTLFTPLAEFAIAFTDAMVEMAATGKSSRLSAAERGKLLKASSTSAEDKEKLFSEWRNFIFEDRVADAAKRGVRYAGMGNNHLDHLLKVGLPANGHPYDMTAKAISDFEKLTERLKKKAK